eukprot:gene4214-4910_t
MRDHTSSPLKKNCSFARVEHLPEKSDWRTLCTHVNLYQSPKTSYYASIALVALVITLVTAQTTSTPTVTPTVTPSPTTPPPTYKPVLMLHGISGSYKDFKHYVQWIHENHPGQIAISLDIDNGLHSTKSMAKQVYDTYMLIDEIVSNNESFADGFHVIGHSQGALILRSVVEMYGFKVDSFISLAGIHMGLYGLDFLPHWFWNVSILAMTDILYTDSNQRDYSLANCWVDAINMPRYLRDNVWLPTINQELPVTIPEYRQNFINVGSVSAFGSPEDGHVIPWNSALFGFYDDNLNFAPMFKQEVYINDTFGLQTLHNQGRLNLVEIPDVKHKAWLTREDLFLNYVLKLI